MYITRITRAFSPPAHSFFCGATLALAELDGDYKRLIAAKKLVAKPAATTPKPTGDAKPANKPSSPAPQPAAASDAGASTPLTTAGIVTASLGAVGIVAGGVAFGLASGDKNDAELACPNPVCDLSTQQGLQAQQAVDSGRTKAHVATAGFIAGGVLAAGGVTMLIVSKLMANSTAPSDSALQLTPTVHTGGALMTLSGRF